MNGCWYELTVWLLMWIYNNNKKNCSISYWEHSFQLCWLLGTLKYDLFNQLCWVLNTFTAILSCSPAVITPAATLTCCHTHLLWHSLAVTHTCCHTHCCHTHVLSHSPAVTLTCCHSHLLSHSPTVTHACCHSHLLSSHVSLLVAMGCLLLDLLSKQSLTCHQMS